MPNRTVVATVGWFQVEEKACYNVSHGVTVLLGCVGTQFIGTRLYTDLVHETAASFSLKEKVVEEFESQPNMC